MVKLLGGFTKKENKYNELIWDLTEWQNRVMQMILNATPFIYTFKPIQIYNLSSICPSMIDQQPEPSQPIDNNSHITALLQFQNQFINIVHSQIYSQPNASEDVIVKFQINHITDLNEQWKKMTEDLHQLLIVKKVTYHNQLRDYFHRILSLDFLPLLRINRYEITQISLFGFDIYIQPLSAILEIINRIDGLKHPLMQGTQNEEFRYKQGDSWQALKKGWSQFIYESSLSKISLNLYILKEYLKIGAKSLVRKDKQIVFTGCSNIFSSFVPRLKELKEIWLLSELAQLSNQLYHFHPSFNYSSFYSLMLPLCPQYQPVFASIQEIALKCLNTNILTPLLLAILRHHENFMNFIEQVDSEIWAPYLNGLVFGLILNFKARILQYEEVMVLLKSAIQKLGLMNKLDTSFIPGELDSQWRQTRDFFISALKAGYNAGDLQTWHPTPHLQIQEKIVQYTRNGIFLGIKDEEEDGKIFMEEDKEKYLKNYLNLLSGNRISLEQFTSNYNTRLLQQISLESEFNYNLFKATHVFRNCQPKFTQSPQALAYLLYFYTLADPKQSALEKSAIEEFGHYLSQKAVEVLEKSKEESLKGALHMYDKKYLKKLNKQKLILYLSLENPKIVLSKVFDLVEKMDEEAVNLISGAIITLFTGEKYGKTMTLKTFSKQYEIPQQVINLPNKIHSCLSFFVEETIFNKLQKSQYSLQILKAMAKAANWLVIPILTFPICFSYESIKEEKLQSFSLWFLKEQSRFDDLLYLIKTGYTEEMRQYYSEVVIMNVCEHAINETNYQVRNEQNKAAIMLLKLLHKIHKQYCKENNQLYKKMAEMYIRLMPKLPSDLQVLKNGLNGYADVMSSLLKDKENLDKWRTMHFKLMSVATSVPIQPVKNFQMIWLPSIKDNVVFSESYGDFKNIQIEPHEQPLKRMDSILENLEKEVEGKNEQMQSWKALSAKSVRESNLKEFQELQQYRQYIPSILNENLIKDLMSETQDLQQLIHFVNILALTPANSYEVIKWAVDNENLSILQTIGYTKQANNLSYPIFKIICSSESREELQANMTEYLDGQSKEAIAEGFTLMEKHIEYLIKLPKFDFLISLNQSNWRFANEKLANFASQLNIPSLILQYTEYLRITKAGNHQYDDKLVKYENIVGKYVRILKQKEHRLFGGENNEHKGYVIEEEEFQLLRNNEMANLKIFVESANFKDLLNRLVEFNAEIKKFSLEIPFQIVSYMEQLNKTANQLTNGHIIGPNFLLSHKFTAARAITDFNFELGSHLENYYLKTQSPFEYEYIPSKTFMDGLSYNDFLEAKAFEKPSYITDMEDKNIDEAIDKLVEWLVKEEAIEDEKQEIKLKKMETESEEVATAFFKLGYLVKKSQKDIKIDVLLDGQCGRKVYSWQVVKEYDSENYHHIKSVLIDDEIGKRKLTMTFNEKELVKNGSKISIHQLNKEKYCNLLAILSIGEGTLKNAQSYSRGAYSAL